MYLKMMKNGKTCFKTYHFFSQLVGIIYTFVTEKRPK